MDYADRVKSLETRPAGNIVIRETLTTTDPVTGVSTTIGKLPDGSVGFQPFIGDIVPPPVATTPVVAAQPGMFTVAWDGFFVNNEEKPRDFQHVNVIGHEMDGINTVRSLVVGVIRLSTESVLVTQEVASIGEAWQFSFESEDYNGNKAVRSARSASVVMLSAVTDEGVNAALEEINGQVISAQNAAVSAQNAADTAQGAADDAAQAVVDLGSITGTIYTQSVTPSANSNSLWIDTGHNNIPRRYLGKISRRVLVANLGGGSSVGSRLSSLGYSVSAISVTPTFDQASNYDIVAFDAGYAGLSSSINTLAVQLLDRGVSIFTSGNDTTSLPYLFTGSGTRGTPKNNIRPVGSHPAAQGWAQYSDNDLAYYLTGVNSSATITGVTLVGSTDQALNIVREHPTSFARWAHVETYATPADVLNAHLNWISDNWVAVQDQGIISASSAAASAQIKADQAFNNAATAASAAGTAQSTADGKNTNWYQPDQPAGTGHKVGDTWFDTDDGYKLRTWNGSVWQTTQDSALAKQIADSKSLVYTQPTVPPIEARLVTTIWYDTSLGLDKVVQKYWNGTAWTALADKTATDAAAVADSKGETIYSTTEPAVAKRLPQNLWVDTTGGINIHKRWDGNAWVVAADSRIASNATAVTAAQATADAKSVVYTQPTTPPVEARLPQTLWNDTSLGLDKIVVKYWNGSAWTDLADKVATDAAAVAATKTKTYFQTSSPALTGNTTGDIWFDTDDGNKAYVWNGGAWAVAQDSSINKSLFGTFPTDIDQTQPNKWLYTRYNKTTAANTIPSYLDIVGVAGTSSTVSDSAQLVVNVGEQYIGQLRTIVYVSSTTSIPVTATHDDGAQIYVDGVSIYTSPVYTANAKFTLSLSAGWHVVDYLWAEQAGGDGFSNVTPLLSTQVSSMFAPVSLSATSQAVSAAQTSANTAMSAQSYSTNASFDDWAGTYPTGYTFWNSTPVKETTIVCRAPNAIRFNVADTTAQAGVAYASILSHAPNLEYFTVELDFYLVSGGLGQAGMILDWGGLTNNRAQINLFDEVPSPATGKWYRVVKTLRRPTNATGTFTTMNGYLMGQWSGHTGGGAAKNIIFDWFNIRPSSAEEILAFNSTTVAQAKADAAQAAAITAAQATTMLATAYSKNPSFDDWASTLPDTYSAFGAITPTKDTTNKRIGAHGLKFTVPGTEDAGINFISNVSHMPNVEYITVELEFMLTSGTLAGAGVLLDWNGLTPIRSLVKLTDHVLTPVAGKWYRISAVVARPANATGTWTSMGGWLMANWNELGTKVAKTITYDWLNVRPSTAEEITAYKAPAKYTELSGATTTAQASADGKNKVHYSTSAASGTVDTTDGNRPFVEGDTWYQRDATTPSKIIAQWEFTGGAWVSRKITGLVLTEVDAGTITVGYLRGENLSATAIDGKTVTGATIQTEQTANRGIKLTSTELAGYDTDGAKNFSLTTGGTLTVRGAIQSGSTIDGATITGTTGIQTSATALRGVKMSNSGILAYDGSGNLTFKLDSATGVVELPGLKANSIAADKLVVGSADNIIAEPSFSNNGISWASIGANGISIDPTGSRKGGPSLKIVNVASQQASYNLPMERPVEAGASFFGSVWVKADVAIPSSGVTLGARVLLSTGAYTYPIFHTNSTIIPANTWTRLSGTTVAPSGAMSVSVYVASQSNLSTGSLWVDYVSVVRAGTGELIVDGAIDGKTITGATIQTETTANRGIKLTSTELGGWDTSGQKNFSLSSAGVLAIRGAIQSGSTITGTQVTGSDGIQTSTSATAGVKLTNTGIKAWDNANNLTFHLDAATGYLELPGLKANSINGDRLQVGTIGTDRLVVGDMTNFVIDPTMTGSGKIAGATYLVSSATAAVSASAPFERVAKLTARDSVENPAQMRPMSPGEVFYAEAWVRAEAAANKNIYLGLWVQSSDGTNNWNTTNTTTAYTSFATPAQGQTGWVKLQGTFTVPTTVVAGKPVVQGRAWVQIAGTTGAETAGWYLTGWNMRRQVDVTTIADGVITTNKIIASGIDASVLKAGTLSAARLGSKSITTDKLVVSSTDNLIVEADFGNGGSSWEPKTNMTINSAAGRGSLPAMRITGTTARRTSLNLVNKVPVGAEDRFRASMWVKSSTDAPSGIIKLGARAYTTATAYTEITLMSNSAFASGSYTNIDGFSPALPAGTVALEFFLDVTPTSTSQVIDIDYIGLTRASDGRLVVDGAIDGKTITGALIRTGSSNNRVQLDSLGLTAYNSSGTETVRISALDGTLSATGSLSAIGVAKDWLTNTDVTVKAVLGNKLARNTWVGYDYLQSGIYFEREGLTQETIDMPRLVVSYADTITANSSSTAVNPAGNLNIMNSSSFAAAPYAASLGAKKYDKTINSDGNEGVEGVLSSGSIEASTDTVVARVEDGSTNYYGNYLVAVGGTNTDGTGSFPNIGQGIELSYRPGGGDPDQSNAYIKVNKGEVGFDVYAKSGPDVSRIYNLGNTLNINSPVLTFNGVRHTDSVGIVLGKTVNQTIADANTWVDLTMETQVYIHGFTHSTTTNAHVVTVQRKGIYTFSYKVAPNTNTGAVGGALKVNGTTRVDTIQRIGNNSGGFEKCALSQEILLNVGDTVTLQLQHALAGYVADAGNTNLSLLLKIPL